MKKFLLLFFLLTCFCCWSYQVRAQAISITGKVVTAEDGYPLPGVSVKIKGTATGTVTDQNGNYNIRASKGQVLVFSFIGTITQEHTVGSSSAINVQLRSDQKSLNEVVVTGFNIKQDRRELTTSVQTVSGAAIAETQRENFLTSLQGRVAGANVTSTSGQPGASASIILRGINSIGGNNQPLFVVDGIRISNNTFSQAALVSNGASRSADYNNRASDLNPEDIESVTVLKGPEAAAIYGSDAASGAIVITTKKGRSGAGSVYYDNDFGFSSAYRFPQIQTEFGRGTNGISNPLTRTEFGPQLAAGTKTYNNLKDITQTGFSEIHSLAFEGGSENATYRLSTEYRDQSGVFPVAYNDRLSLRFTGSAKISPKFTSTASFNYFNTNNRKLNKGNSGTFIDALTWPTDDDVRNYLNPDGSRRRINAVNSTSDLSIDFDNPLWDAHNNISKDVTNRALSNVDLSYDPYKWLNIRGLVGVDYYTTQGNNLISQYSSAYQNSALNGFNATSGISAGGIIDNYTDNDLLINGSLFATAKKTFGDFKTTLAVGGEAFSNRDEIIGYYGEKFLQPDFNSINNTTPTSQRSGSAITQVRRMAAIGRFNLVWKNMLVFNATGRNDWSSTLYDTQKYSYFYPSAGVAWEFTQLDALKNNKVLSYGKLRFSYAEVGKDAPPYTTQSKLIQQTTTGGGYEVDVTGSNPLLKPETDKSFEVGGEFHFFNGRLGADIAYYKTLATNQIFNPRISYGSGYVIKYVNGGEVDNHGIELQLTGTPVKTNNFTWDSYINFTRARGKVVNLGGLPEYYNSDTWLYANARASIFPGGSTTAIASYDYARNNKGQILIDPSSGLPISNGTFIQTGDRQPDFTIGFGNTFSFKNFSLSFLIDMRKGGDIFDANEMFLTRYGLSTTTLDRMTPRVVPGVLKDGNENSPTPTVNTIQVTPYYQNTFYTSNIESDFIEHNINWIRLKDITLSYTIPQKLLSRQRTFKYASVFVTATDVFMITNYKGADPDVNGTNASTLGSGAAGFDFGALSTPRIISFGIRVRL
jgi:TonB-linked SusC/RagA family outer membrane protein